MVGSQEREASRVAERVYVSDPGDKEKGENEKENKFSFSFSFSPGLEEKTWEQVHVAGRQYP